MKYRSVAAVILLPFITFGIYSLYWLVRTKIEMNLRGADPNSLAAGGADR